MTYQVLARKWRPKTFASMAGQEHVLQALINALDQNRLHHAYLFTGTRGVGKTTVARIFAKCLNCEKGITSQPCNQCDACVAIDAGRFVDLLEIDAASRTKVEDTRELLDNVQYAPAAGRFKIYLIDEVHMLSGHSFNALLKTLEEPPPHVKFLLATTDPQKLPVTVLSRCLQFHLKNLLPELIADYLQTVLNEEKLPYEKPALDQLAKAADGSMRDALSLLDQAIAFSNGDIKTAAVHAMLGTIEDDHVLRILSCLANNDAGQLLQISAELAELGMDFYQALESLLSHLHQLAVLHALNFKSQPEQIQLLEPARAISKQDIQLFYQIALIGRRDLSLAPSAKVGFEMVLLRMLDFRPAALVTKPSMEIPEIPSSSLNDGSHTPKTGKIIQPVEKPLNPAPDATISHHWIGIVGQLSLTGMAHALANNCELIAVSENSITLALAEQHAPLRNRAQENRVEEALQKYFNRPLKLVIQTNKTEMVDSPAKMQENHRRQEKQKAKKAMEMDPSVSYLLESFQATIDNASIHPVTEEE